MKRRTSFHGGKLVSQPALSLIGNEPDQHPTFQRFNVSTLSLERAFTLLELLVVLAVIGTIATLTLPALKGLGQSNLTSAAAQQVVDDLALARRLAISGRTDVSMVFVATNWIGVINSNLPPAVKAELSDMITYQYTGYALHTSRSVGDQPGQTRGGRYLTEWKKLPEGMLIAPEKLTGTTTAVTNEYARPHEWSTTPIFIEFPHDNSFIAVALRAVTFNSSGRLVNPSGVFAAPRDEIVALARGSIFFQRDADGNLLPSAPEVNLSSTNYNYIRIDAITGRAKVEVAALR